MLNDLLSHIDSPIVYFSFTTYLSPTKGAEEMDWFSFVLFILLNSTPSSVVSSMFLEKHFLLA